MTDTSNQAVMAMIEKLEVEYERMSGSHYFQAAALLRALLAEREWRDMDSAPKDGTHILVCFGESIPDVPLIYVAQKVEGEHCKELGYIEFEFVGAWMVWSDNCDWFMLAPETAVAWMQSPPTGVRSPHHRRQANDQTRVD